MTPQRVFIAIEASAEIRARVARLQDEMRAAGARVRWVKPQNVHFTVRFIGDVARAQVARAVVAARQTAEKVAAFDVSVGGLGAFPSLDRPNVIWVGTTDGADTMERVAEDLEARLGRYGFPPDRRRFRPHLTLARVPDQRHWGDLVRALRRFCDVDLGRQSVTALTVFESRLTPSGPVYFTLEQVPLGQRLNQ